MKIRHKGKKGFVLGLMVLLVSVTVASTITFSSVNASQDDTSGTDSSLYLDMPYRGIIIGSYWQEWPHYGRQEYLEPNILFIGIHQYDGPMMSHYYRFEVRVFHQRDSSLFVDSFNGIKKPHFLFGFSRFFTMSSRTHLRQFDGEFHGFVVRRAGTENIYDVLMLRVNGTASYWTQTGFEHCALSEVLRHRHYIELLHFNGTKTAFYLSGTGLFKYYYSVPYGPHPWLA